MHLENQYIIYPISILKNVEVNLSGVKKVVDFKVI